MSVSLGSVWNSNSNICFFPQSDEELEDNKALLYLPIAPEVEDPEENPFGPPPDASGLTGTTEDASASGDKKQRQPSSEMGPAKKKARTTTIELKGVPSDGKLHNRSSGSCLMLKLAYGLHSFQLSMDHSMKIGKKNRKILMKFQQNIQIHNMFRSLTCVVILYFPSMTVTFRCNIFFSLLECTLSHLFNCYNLYTADFSFLNKWSW